jgi:Mor family transcriptional regulator
VDDQLPESLEEIREALDSAFLQFGELTPATAAQLADIALMVLVDCAGGTMLYVATADRVKRTIRDEQIRRDRRAGATLDELAARYQCSTGTVRNALKRTQQARG